MPYAFEEDLTLQQLGCVTDGHPNAYAVRLRVSLAVPVVMDLPWDICRETVGYITSLSHVSGRCRLTEAEEGMSLISGAGGVGLEAGIAEPVGLGRGTDRCVCQFPIGWSRVEPGAGAELQAKRPGCCAAVEKQCHLANCTV